MMTGMPSLHETEEQRQIRKLEIRVATVEAENRRLRRYTPNGKTGRLLQRTAIDARQLVQWRFSGYSIARRQAYEYGMSERRWAWALALLKLAGVVAIDTSWADEFLDDDPVSIESRIQRAIAKVENNGVSLLIFRLPKGRARVKR